MIRAILASRNYKWWVFGILGTSTFLSVVDHGSALVALPDIERHFGTDLPTVQWVIIGSALAVSALLLPMGRLGDIAGRKSMYIAGFSVFVMASAVAGFSPTLEVLIGAKVIQGVGSAMVQANAMAIILSVFPGSERGKSLGYHASIVGVGAIASPAVGGLLVSAFSWRAVFLMNLPIGLVAIAATALIIRSSRASQRNEAENGSGFDWLGAVLSGLFLLAALLIIGNGHRAGWTSPQVLAGCIAAVMLLAMFVWWELRVQSPMLDLRMFQRKAVSLGVIAGWLSFLGGAAGRFMMPFYLQRVLEYSPRDVGLFMIPPAVCMVIVAPLSGSLSLRLAAADHRGHDPFVCGLVLDGHAANPRLLGGPGCGGIDAPEHRHRDVQLPQQQRRPERGGAFPVWRGVGVDPPGAELGQRDQRRPGNHRGGGDDGVYGSRTQPGRGVPGGVRRLRGGPAPGLLSPGGAPGRGRGHLPGQGGAYQGPCRPAGPGERGPAGQVARPA